MRSEEGDTATMSITLTTPPAHQHPQPREYTQHAHAQRNSNAQAYREPCKTWPHPRVPVSTFPSSAMTKQRHRESPLARSPASPSPSYLYTAHWPQRHHQTNQTSATQANKQPGLHLLTHSRKHPEHSTRRADLPIIHLYNLMPESVGEKQFVLHFFTFVEARPPTPLESPCGASSGYTH